MACHQTGDKPLPEPMMTFYRFDTEKQIQWNLTQNTMLFIQENASEGVACKMSAILS